MVAKCCKQSLLERKTENFLSQEKSALKITIGWTTLASLKIK
jgi:hypothetical protein